MRPTLSGQEIIWRMDMSLTKNLNDVLDLATSDSGMDVIIVSTTSEDQEEYWQSRLEAGRGQVCRSSALILAVNEDWPGGAGNGLGTLYAIAKASLKAKRAGRDLLKELSAGATVGLYHTAGKGTRLAPLPGSEGNNKPAVKLPGIVTLDGAVQPLTILEAVIRQTAAFATSRAGRVSVFWGDQVFIPSAQLPEASTHHADILAKLGAMPDAETWAAKGLSNYGLIAVAADGDAAQVEKVSHAVATELIDGGVIRVDGGIGVSLGSFSISHQLTRAMLEEFKAELAAKTEKMDTDPHFWMPLTLDEETYVKTMTAKGEDESRVVAHFERMRSFAEKFTAANPGMGTFGCVNVGDDCYWWDYGTVNGYVKNNLKVLGDDDEAEAMRRFFGLTECATQGSPDGTLAVQNSILIDCEIKEGLIKGYVLVGVVADRIDTEGSIMINVAAPDVCGDDLLLYNVVDKLSLHLDDGTVRADAFVKGPGQLPMWTFRCRDGKDDWDVTLEGNTMSYGDLNTANASAKLTDSAQLATQARVAVTRILTARL